MIFLYLKKKYLYNFNPILVFIVFLFLPALSLCIFSPSFCRRQIGGRYWFLLSIAEFPFYVSLNIYVFYFVFLMMWVYCVFIFIHHSVFYTFSCDILSYISPLGMCCLILHTLQLQNCPPIIDFNLHLLDVRGHIWYDLNY